MDFLILYEHKVRELENACLLKLELTRRGYEVEICNINADIEVRHLLGAKPKVIITPWLYSDRTVSFIHTKFGHVERIVNLQYEQVLSRKWEAVGYHTPKGMAQKGYHICWGQGTRMRLLNAGVCPENIVLTGSIQMDLLKPEFSGYYYTRDEVAQLYDINPTKKWMLYISSFTLASASRRKVDSLAKTVNTDVDDLFYSMKLSKEETIKWIERFLMENQDFVFIYRPHPNESGDIDLDRLANEYQNFRVISDLSVKQWIKVSDHIYTWISTAISEAYFANKTCNILRPIPLSEDLDMVIYRNARTITSFAEFEESVAGENSEFPLDASVLDFYYGGASNFAYASICDFCEELYKKEVTLPNMAHMSRRVAFFLLKYARTCCSALKLTTKWLLSSKFKDLKFVRLVFGSNTDIACQGEIQDIENRLREYVPPFIS